MGLKDLACIGKYSSGSRDDGVEEPEDPRYTEPRKCDDAPGSVRVFGMRRMKISVRIAAIMSVVG